MKNNGELTEGWAIISPCMGGDEFGCFTEDSAGERVPCLYQDREDALREAADFLVTELDQFIKGERSSEDTRFELEDYPAWTVRDGNLYIAYDEDGIDICTFDINDPY